MFRTLLICTVFAVAAPAFANPASDPSPSSTETPAMTKKANAMMKTSTAAYADVLSRGLTPGAEGVALFDYAQAKANGDHETIKAFIAEQVALTPSTMTDPEATAYWANLYNAVTLDVVLDDYPIKSIRSLGSFSSGPWKREVVTVEGETLSLDNIEHDILRVDYATPYIHYMVNCASFGCPNLRNELWTADGLDEDQKVAASDFINSDRGVMIRKDGRIAVSKIYNWFAADFGDSEDDLRAHLAQRATGARLKALSTGAKFKGSHYNWDLNQPK
ncbi:DUF547 domain-containing protein [Algimonas arctica]|uniref:DUF547 domain-containing protein n=1 Tax=Algimonas arctica TaxID=1479486 RepID=A0A8J3CMW3_9PROT|nr:DUF547 domain-containing protein [Algimonas arctica]GHA87117.1 DUF547 domain-containing protein [Algimonas arctica]